MRTNKVPVYAVHEDGYFSRLNAATKNIATAEIGVGVMCENVKCIFELCVYKYKGRLFPLDSEDIATPDNDSADNVSNCTSV